MLLPCSTEYEVHPIKTTQSMWSNYCYLVIEVESRHACLIDPSWEYEKITAHLHTLQADLKAVLLTHSHFDHVNLVDRINLQFQPQVYMSKQEIDFYGYHCENLNAIEEGATISLGGMKIECMLTPGHTAGSMCFLVLDSFFTGDTVFIEGCGICDTYGGSPEKMFESIQRIKKRVPHHVHVYPGHSYGKEPGQTLQSLFKENIYFQIEKREHFIQFRMRKNQPSLFNFH